MEAAIANLKSQALVLEEAYQTFLAAKPDYATPRTVSFVLGGTFLAGTGTSFALSQSFGAGFVEYPSDFDGYYGGDISWSPGQYFGSCSTRMKGWINLGWMSVAG
jgi:hypothetical protein